MAAGFFAGFGEQLSKDVARRQDELGILIKENLANARGAKRDYAKRKSLADTILDTTQAIQNKYGLKDEQAIALAEAYGTDLPGLQVKLDETDIQVRSTGGIGLGAEQVMSYVNMTNELAPLKGMTKLQAIEKLMGLNTAELAKEADPKSEGSQTRSFIRAALAFDPQLQAAEKMEGIKGPGGMSYAQLLEMQEAGFAPEDVVGGVTRSGGLAYDYTASTAKQTTKTYTSDLSTKLYEVAMDDNIGWDSLSSKDPSLDKKAAKANLLGAGQALARLERSIVLKNLGKDLSLSAFRKGVLDDIYKRIDNPEELKTLQESVANGTALEIVQRTGGDLTEKDIDAIIAGTVGEEEGASASQPAAAASVTNLNAAMPVAAAETTTPLAAQAATLNPIVARMLEEQGIDTGGISNTGLSDEELRLREPSADAATKDEEIIKKALERSDAIDVKLAEQKRKTAEDELSMQRREDALNDLDFKIPEPPKSVEPINTSLINTPDDLRAAIEERTGTMPRDYLKEFVPLIKRINKQLKSFEESVNVSADKAEEAITIDNIGESLNNIMVRMFDTVVGDETLEERIMKNEGQRNRAAALAKLQEQFAALTLFPERTPVDIKDIDPYPTMAEMASEGLHSTQDKINASIASTAKAFLAKLGIGKSNEEAETKAEPLVARPKKAKKPKEMTSSDKARLKRAQKADQLSGDASLLEMLVEKYGIALVQKEMGL